MSSSGADLKGKSRKRAAKAKVVSISPKLASIAPKVLSSSPKVLSAAPKTLSASPKPLSAAPKAIIAPIAEVAPSLQNPPSANIQTNTTTVDSSVADQLRGMNSERRGEQDLNKITLPSRRAADIFHRPLDRRKVFETAAAAAKMEKAPPGTRTKMLKIIYDHKAQFSAQRRRNQMIKLAVATFIILGTYIVAKKTWELMVFTANKTAEVVNVDEWWKNVTKDGRKPARPEPQIEFRNLKPTTEAANPWKASTPIKREEVRQVQQTQPRAIVAQPKAAAKPVAKTVVKTNSTRPTATDKAQPAARKPVVTKKSKKAAKPAVRKAQRESSYEPIRIKSSFE